MATKVIQGNFSVVVIRDGTTVSVGPNQPFDFNDSEIDDIIAAHGEESLRDPVDETAQVKSGGKKGAAKPAASAEAEKL